MILDIFYNRKKKIDKKYILFIDLNAAFDSVSIPNLINKLINKKVSFDVINALIKLMNCSNISTDMENIISIYAGVAQGKLFSSILFNINIDDFFKVLNLDYICF